MSSFLIYGVGTFGRRVGSVILVPIYTRFLTPEDYGILNLAAVFTQVLVTTIGLGVPVSIFRFYIGEDDEEGRRAVLSACLAIMGLATVAILVLGLLSPTIARWLLDDANLSWLLVLSLISLLGDLLLKIPFAKIRAGEQSEKFVLYNSSIWLVTVLFSVLFVVGFRWGVYGIIGAQALVHLPFAIGLLTPIFRDRLPRPDPARIKRILAYGLPLVPSVLSIFVLKLSDRYIIKLFEPMAVVGLYSIGYRVAEVIVLAGTAFQFAWVPFAFRTAKEEGGRERMAHVGSTWFGVAVLGALTIALFAREALWILTPPTYHGAVVVVPILMIGLAASAIYQVGSIGLQLGDRTRHLFPVNAGAAILNIGLNLWWVPRYGMLGAAWGTAISFLVQFALVFAFSQRVFPLPIPRRRWLAGGATALFLGWGGLRFEQLDLVAAIAGKLGALGLAVFAFMALGLTRPSHIRRLLALRGRGRKRRASRSGPEDEPPDLPGA